MHGVLLPRATRGGAADHLSRHQQTFLGCNVSSLRSYVERCTYSKVKPPAEVMADIRATARSGCDERCGCPNPCPGGDVCRCASKESTATGVDHKMCSCGEHCSCNPCNCGKNQVAGTGKLHCQCGPGCGCATCAS